MKDFLQEAMRLLEIKSVAEEGNEDLVNFLIPVLERMGAKLILQQVPHSLMDHSKRQFNLIGIFGDDLVDSRTKKGLLLTTHSDTAAPGNKSDWTANEGDPLLPKVENEKVYGLGAAHAKMDLFAKLRVCEQYAKTPLKQPLYFSATCGGESPLAGARYLIQSGVVNPRHVLVGHPTGLRIVHGQKSQLTFTVRLSYVAIERDAQQFNTKIYLSARSPSGDVALHAGSENALTKMLGLVDRVQSSRVPAKLFSIQAGASMNRLPDMATVGMVIPSQEFEPLREKFRSFFASNQGEAFELRFGGTGDRGVKLLPQDMMPALFAIFGDLQKFGEELAQVKDDNFSVPTSTAVINSITQDRDSLSLSVQLHLLPELSSNEKKKEIEQKFRERLQGILRQYPALSLECRRLVSTPRFHLDVNHEFVKALGSDLERSGTTPMPDCINTVSEAGYFHERGYDTLLFGPGGEDSHFHAANECVDLGQVNAAIRFYSQVVETLCVRGI